METLAAPLSGTAAAPRARWFRADNIRWILLFNVIAEHMLTQTGITENWIITVIVCWSRMITMPGFCFVSGYFSKKGDKCYDSAIFDFLIPYLIFNTLFVACYGTSAPNIFTPTFAYWYMVCMFAWKLVTKALQQIKYIIPLAFIVALAVGPLSDVDHFLCISRTITFLPYYLIGMKMSREDVRKIENLPKLLVLAVTLAVMALWGWLNVKGVYHIDFYYYWRSFHFYDPAQWEALHVARGLNDAEVLFANWSILKCFILRAAGYVVSLLLIVFLFVLVPDKSLPVMRDGGTRTMVPYLLHTYVIMFMRNLYAIIPALDRWYITVPIALLMAVAVMSVLGLPVFNDWYNALVKFIKKLLKKEPAKV